MWLEGLKLDTVGLVTEKSAVIYQDKPELFICQPGKLQFACMTAQNHAAVGSWV